MGAHNQCPQCELSKISKKFDQIPIEMFLGQQYGISRFLTTDGNWILDKKDELSFSMGNSVDHDKIVTHTKMVNFHTDFFNVLRQITRVYPISLGSDEFKFFGKEPLPGEYNAAIIKRLGKFSDGGYDGSCDNEMWSLLLLKVEVRNKNAEELAEDERRRNFVPDPLDEGPAF